MKGAMIYRALLKREPFVRATPCELGTWMLLQVHAADQESGIHPERATRWTRVGQARIARCKAWDDAEWLRTVGATAGDVAKAVARGLAMWRGADLVLQGYDLWGQRRATEKLAQLRKVDGQDNPRTGPPIREVHTDGPNGAPERTAPLPSPPLPGSGSPSDPPLQTSIPHVTSPGGKRREGAPPGATSTGADRGPEGFEAWAAVFPKWDGPPWWRDEALAAWAALDLEAIADEVLAHTLYEMGHSGKWMQLGPPTKDQPNGRRWHFVKNPDNYLRAEEFRKPGPWRAKATKGPTRTSSGTASPTRKKSRDTEPVPAGAVLDQQGVHGWLLQLLADVDASEEKKTAAKRAWIHDHPGQLPPWATQPQAPGAPS